ncbi:hypothetical protein DFH11DRAFT_1630424 [Phellopilus nigrolimitatus]|nr:hypothetical protein DFH11DRAFT_1630424 [Phellopilus nigrolimitatus]
MRHSVVTPSYLFLRSLDNLFSLWTLGSQIAPSSVGPLSSSIPFPSTSPSGWVPLYTMVTFRPDISYSTAKLKAEKQQKIVANLGCLGLAIGIAAIGLAILIVSRRTRI